MTTPPRTPTTAAGRATMRGIIGGSLALWRDDPDAIADLILAIEDEARAEAAATLFEAQAALLTEGLARDHLRSLGQRLSDAIADYAAVQRSGWSAEAEADPIRLAYMAALRDFRAVLAAERLPKEPQP